MNSISSGPKASATSAVGMCRRVLIADLEPDQVIDVPTGSDSIDITLSGVVFGTNGLRFEVESPGEASASAES